MDCWAAQITMGEALEWLVGLPLVVRLFGSAAIIFGLSLLVSLFIGALRREPQRPPMVSLAAGIATLVALVVWSAVTGSGSVAMYQLFGGVIALVARALAAPNRTAVLDWVSDQVDRISYKIVYVALAVLLALPFIAGTWPVKPRPRAITKGLFDAIEECAETGRPVLLINAWIMSSRGENQPQFECIVEHLMRQRVKFVMLSMEVDTTIVGRGICQDTERYYNNEFGEDYIQYGRDWLTLGYRPIYGTGFWPAWVENMKSKGIVGAFRTDYANRELSQYPIMQRPEAALIEEEAKRKQKEAEAAENGAESSESASEAGTGEDDEARKDLLQLGDFGLIIEVHFTGTLPELVGLVRLDKDYEGLDGKPRIKTALGTVDMVVNQMLPFYDTGDMSGILAGMQGAGEYSELLTDKYGPGPSRKGVVKRYNTYSIGLLFVVTMIVLGNLCTLWKKLRERETASGVE